MLISRHIFVLLFFHLFHYFCHWVIDASGYKVLFNHGLDTNTCMTSMIHMSYIQCLTHFRSNTTRANAVVYKRRFSMCYTYIISGTFLYKQEPGSVLVHGRKVGKCDTYIYINVLVTQVTAIVIYMINLFAYYPAITQSVYYPTINYSSMYN